MSNISKFLINEPFLQVSVSLMLEIGQSKAIVLQKLYSMTLDGKTYSGTYQDWHKMIPYFSDEHLKRILVWLEAEKLIVSSPSKDKRIKCYSVNFNVLSSKGFEIVGFSIFHKKYQNKKMSFILPSLVNLVGITSAIFLQDFYYQNGNKYGQMTKKEINKWVPYISLKQVKNLFQDLQNRELIKSKFLDDSNKNDGKYYLVNKQKINELLINSVKESSENIENHKRSVIVDNSMIVDNFIDQNHKSSPPKPQKFPPKTTKVPPHSIDQDQVKIFKENNTYIMGREQECGIIPNANVDIVCLTERLITHGFKDQGASKIIKKFGHELINRVTMLAADRERNSGEKMGAGWITNTAKNLKEGQHMNLQTTRSEDSIIRKHGDREREEYFARLATCKRSTVEKKERSMAEIYKILPNAKRKRESSRELLERLAVQKRLS